MIIGDENSGTFKPHARFRRWGDECYWGFAFPTNRNITPSFDGSKITWTSPSENIIVNFYEQPESDQQEYGGFEYEIILTKQPAASSITFNIQKNGLIFIKQPPLTQWEIDRGNVRLDNVIGSYAVYHATRQPIYSQPGEADLYKTAKVFHIYRPLATDALGNQIWLDIDIDDVAGRCTISCDPTWLNNATYPVTIDPTVGYTSLGQSLDDTGAYAVAVVYAAPSSGDANPGTAYVGGTADSGTANVKAAAYVYNAAGPWGQTRLAVTAANMALTTTKAFQSTAITWTGITATNYFLMAWSNSSATNLAYDAGSGTGWYKLVSGLGDTPPDPFFDSQNSGAWNNRLSIYVDYGTSTTPITVNNLTIDSLAGGEIV